MYWIYDIYIWNPSTGFHKKIPLSSFSSNSDIQHYINFYGFGYDQSTDDYLLVTMSFEDDYPLRPHLEFFSLRANMWKEIGGIQLPYSNIVHDDKPAAGLLFNGAIHSLAHCSDLPGGYVIVAFDLMEKKLINMHLPDVFDREPMEFGLWVFGEFLSLWAVCDGDVHGNLMLEVWVMKEYKVNSPWTKTLVLPYDGYSPICSTKSGDFIGTNGHTALAKYNDQGQLLEHHSYFNNRYGWEVALYIESMLLLPDNEQA
ncbi:F-box protein [Trifolium medium]|uniref:F-box protein n=1 Tax=Trifolium medium TaxID=97028 RepID=A0A392P4P7_9FABA|nr:F-box protein [Trifolium medium]